MKHLGYITYLYALCVASHFWHAFVLVKLWTWFVTPVFHTPQLTTAVAAGLSLVVQFLTMPYQSSKPDEEMEAVLKRATEATILKPLIALIVGSIIKMCL